jgi:hypothetical protein
MSLSPNSPAICLETPPASPSAAVAINLSLDSPVNLQDLQSLAPVAAITPVKRPRRYERGQKRKRADEGCSPPVETQELSEERFWGTEGSSPREVETDIVGPEPTNDLQPAGYFDFVDAVLADIAPFYQISRTLFVSTGWSLQTRTCTVSDLKNKQEMLMTYHRYQIAWYHLQMIRIGREVIMTCLCPYTKSSNNPDTDCVHIQFLREYREERFPDDGTFEKGEHKRLYLFLSN